MKIERLLSILDKDISRIDEMIKSAENVGDVEAVAKLEAEKNDTKLCKKMVEKGKEKEKEEKK